MLTCLCDAFFGEVGIATVRVLEALGCEVDFPEDQTCCGQPPFNAGDWRASRPMAERWLTVFDPALPVVTPSSSCAAMVRHGFGLMNLPEHRTRTFELAEFLASIGVTSWPPSGRRLDRRLAYHRACHGRVLGLGDTVETLLSTIPGLEVVPFEQAEQCCGFGGAFSIGHGSISAGIGLEKLDCVSRALDATDDRPGVLASGDMGCLMHLNGLIERHHLPLTTCHYSQILAEALDA